MIITISDMWKNQQKMLDNDNQIKLSSLIGFLGDAEGAQPSAASCFKACLLLPGQIEADCQILAEF